MTRLKSFRVFLGTALLLLAVTPSLAYAGDLSRVYFNDFSGGLSVAPGVNDSLGGVTSTESVQGYAGIGTGASFFGGNFLRNASPGSPTSLTLTDLPPHSSIDINFLLAIIDSWDGSSFGGCGICYPDFFTVRVDGNIVFSESFGFNGEVYAPSPGVLLTEYTPLGFHPFYGDAAYDMGLNPALGNISHSASTLTIEWDAGGAGYQGGGDESWAIDNVEIVLELTPQFVDVDIDIKPGEEANTVNLKAKGIVQVAVLTTGDFDAENIDPDSVLFAGASPKRWMVKDVDHDGEKDLLFDFKIQDLNLDEDSVEAALSGITSDGVQFVGEDSIRIVPK